MRLVLKCRSFELSDELRAHATKRVRFALGRLTSHIRSVEVALVDINGPRGGLDKKCRIVVRGGRFQQVCVQALDSSAEAAVSAAAERVARAVTRAIERQRGRQTFAEEIT